MILPCKSKRRSEAPGGGSPKQESCRGGGEAPAVCELGLTTHAVSVGASIQQRMQSWAPQRVPGELTSVAKNLEIGGNKGALFRSELIEGPPPWGLWDAWGGRLCPVSSGGTAPCHTRKSQRNIFQLSEKGCRPDG